MCSFFRLSSISCLVLFPLFISPFCFSKDYTLADHQLAKIIDRQLSFFSLANKVTEKELTRKAQDIVASYEAYISENPKDAHALILFGKFLHKVGQSKHAVDCFLEADSINPKHAVVKQQLANYLIEQGRPVDAFPFLLMTLRYDPNVSAYHYQMGNFLYVFKPDLVNAGILTEESLNSFMFKSFKESFLLSPNNFDYGLRHAQSFFDSPNESSQDALNAWNNLLNKFPGRSKAEKDYITLCKASVLLELNRKSLAKKLIDSVSTSSLEKTKVSLLQQVKKKNSEKINNSLIKQLKKKSSKTGVFFRFPDDSHLRRMRELTSRLHEEKLLSTLKTDVISASVDSKGKITLKLSRTSDSPFFKNQN